MTVFQSIHTPQGVELDLQWLDWQSGRKMETQAFRFSASRFAPKAIAFVGLVPVISLEMGRPFLAFQEPVRKRTERREGGVLDAASCSSSPLLICCLD
jgi:hypothetical protein